MAEPVIFHYTSWDHFQAGEVTLLAEMTGDAPGSDGGWTYSGLVGSMVSALRGSGQAIRAPNGLTFNFVDLPGTGNGSCDTLITSFMYEQSSMASERTIVKYANDTGVVHVELRMTTTGFLKLYNGSGAVIATSAGPQRFAGDRLHVELGVYVHNTLGITRVRVNGTDDPLLRKDGTAGAPVDTQNAGTNLMARVVFTNPVGDYDEFAVLKGAGGFTDAGMLSMDAEGDPYGGPYVHTAWAVADGFYTDFDKTPTGPEAYYTFIGETLKDDMATFLWSQTATEKQCWRYDRLPVDAYRILDMADVIAFGSPNANADWKAFIRLSGTDYDHPMVHVGDAADSDNPLKMIMRRWPVNVVGGLEWPVATLSHLEHGLQVTTGTGRLQISQAVRVTLYQGAPIPPEPYDGRPLLAHKTHRFANLFKVEIRDTFGATYDTKFYTDCNATIIGPDGNSYKPAGGMQGSAHTDESALREPNVEILGVLTDDAITVDDLRSGRYGDARITQYVVDWMFPWAGPIKTWVYWVGDIEYDGSYWKAQLSGLAHRLRRKVGRYYDVICDYILGSDDVLHGRCKVNLFALTNFAVPVSQVTDRRVFRFATLPAGLANDWFNFGYLTFIDGDAHDLTFEIRDYVAADREVSLQLPVPFDVVIGWRANLAPGCNKLFTGDCLLKYNNQINFGGFPFIVTTDGLLETP